MVDCHSVVGCAYMGYIRIWVTAEGWEDEGEDEAEEQMSDVGEESKVEEGMCHEKVKDLEMGVEGQ